MDDIDEMWEAYSKTRDYEIRNKLILHYIFLLKYVSGRLSIHFGTHVEYDELMGYGIFGLIDAINKFDYTKGIKFETYASLRIRGSIIDGIRKYDWVPRTLRQKNKLIENATKEFQNLNGTTPDSEQLAEKLNITVDEVRDIARKNAVLSVISLNDFLEQNNEVNLSSTKYPETPESEYNKMETKEILIKTIKELSKKEQMVISLYYFNDLTLKEISKVMEVSESRISQLHSKAILKLQDKLGADKAILFSK